MADKTTVAIGSEPSYIVAVMISSAQRGVLQVQGPDTDLIACTHHLSPVAGSMVYCVVYGVLPEVNVN